MITLTLGAQRRKSARGFTPSILLVELDILKIDWPKLSQDDKTAPPIVVYVIIEYSKYIKFVFSPFTWVVDFTN